MTILQYPYPDYTKSFTEIEKDDRYHYVRLATDFRYFFYHKVWALCAGNTFHHSTGFDLLSEYVIGVLNGQVRDICIAIPPRNSKTLIWSIGLPLFSWIRCPHYSYINATHHNEVLQDFSEKRQRIVTDMEYQQNLGGTKIIKNTQREIANSKAGEIIAMIAAKAKTGRGANKALILDDVISAAEYSPARSNTIANKISGSLLSRLSDKKNGSNILIMQRLGYEDPFKIATEEWGWEYVALQSRAEKKTIFTFPSGRVWEREKGDILNPGHEPEEVLARIPKHVFETQYQQNGVAPPTGLITESAIRLYKVRGSYQRIMLSVDSAQEISEGSCNWGITVFGCYSADDRYMDLLFAEALKYDFAGGLKRLLDLIEKWVPTDLLIEKKSTGAGLISMIEQARQKRERDIPANMQIVGIDPRKSKEDRFADCLPFFARGGLAVPDIEALPMTEPWVLRYKGEILGFPASRDRDLVDSTTQAVSYYDTHTMSYGDYLKKIKGRG